MQLKTQAPITVLYRGDVQDTAALIGLVQARIPIGIIAYTGSLESEKLDYLQTLNHWLGDKGISPILIHPKLTWEQLKQISSSPTQEWGWNFEECKVVIKLADLALPPNL